MSPYLMKLNHILTIRRLLHWMHVTMQELLDDIQLVFHLIWTSLI